MHREDDIKKRQRMLDSRLSQARTSQNTLTDAIADFQYAGRCIRFSASHGYAVQIHPNKVGGTVRVSHRDLNTPIPLTREEAGALNRLIFAILNRAFRETQSHLDTILDKTDA
jgi:hypothetical protein